MEKERKQPGAARRLYFTDAAVAALKPMKGKQYLMWDAWTGTRQRGPDPARGLAVLVSPQGTKSYRVAFYFPGNDKAHYKHLGRMHEDVTSVEEARKLARAARAMARKGDDPRAGDAKASDAFGAALDRYIASEQKGRRGNQSADKTKAVILHHCKAWLTRPLGTILRGEIDALLDSIRDGTDGKPGKPYMANRLYSHLHHFFAWAAGKHLITASPMADIQRPFTATKARSREWFKGTAGNEAIRALWKAADEIGGVDGKYVKLMVLTGKRKSALAAMQWQEIGDDWFWDAPESKVKNKRLHGIPLPKMAHRVLSPRQAQGLVFEGMAGRLDALQARVRKLTGLDDFFWHGVRHLVESKTAEIGILPHVRDQLFDHASKRGSGKGYDHHSYRPEMSAALESWAGYIESLLIGAAGVTQLR